MADLKRYRAKRDPAATPEPFAGGRASGKPIFVVQRHDARRLHYDFRLERDGVLASWAVPKGVPMKPGERALAVHVEDHPLAYATFAGEIPAGQYGAGSVEIWDHGSYELLEEKPNGQLSVRLQGERLRGVWTLVPARMDDKEQNWLLIRRSDGGEPAALSTGAVSSDAVSSPAAASPAASAVYTPMLATLAEEIPAGGPWVYEVKWDGYRALAYVRDGDCRLVSRNGNELTPRFATVASAIARATGASAVLDGEVCALDARGRASFSAMQQGTGTPVYYAFDVLEVEGEPVIGRPLEERRATLAGLIAFDKTVRLSESFSDGQALLAVAAEQELEGIVAKRLDSPYRPGKRTRDWLKLKTHGRQEFLVAGYTRGQGNRDGSFGSLVLAVNEPGGLRYVGNVGTGFREQEAARLLGLLRPLERPDPPFAVPPRMPRVRRGEVTWVEPRQVVEVEFSEWTHDGHLRQPSYKGTRDDKPPREVRRERPIAETLGAGKRTLTLSNLDKVFWPDDGITKGDLLAYYRAIAPVLVPHLKGRPFTMRRFPDGIAGKAFFQKDAPSHMPDWIPTFRALVSTRERPAARKWIEFPVVDDELALLWMVNMGCIDMNAWYSRVDKPDRPDFVLFDLDPTPETPWADTVEVARILHELLDALELTSLVKTSGGKGLHVLVPIARRSTYPQTRAFAELVADAIVRGHPTLATREWRKSRRHGVLIDANQNGEGKTIASAYSVRARPGAPVSTPLRWDEVDGTLDPAAFTMATVPARVERLGDLHAQMRSSRQSLAVALRALER